MDTPQECLTPEGVMMERLAPMRAIAAREPFDGAGYLFEVKWDGIRALSGRDERGWRLWGRGGTDDGPRYPELAGLARDKRRGIKGVPGGAWQGPQPKHVGLQERG